MSQNFEVYFVHGTTESPEKITHLNENFIEIPLNYAHGSFQNTYKYLLSKKRNSLAKLLLIGYYFFTGEEIFDLGKEFRNFIKKTNLTLTPADKVLVSYPSMAIHNLGFILKKKYGCKLILDYRDPGIYGYRQISENKVVSFLRKLFLKKRELKNLHQADEVTTVSDSIKALFPTEYHPKITVIKNGYFCQKANLSLIKPSNGVFKIVYLGTIYSIQLVDQTFFKALRVFIDQHNIQPHQLQLKFVGAASSLKLAEIINHYKLDPYTLITPRLAIEKAYEELYDASLFLHLKYGDRQAIITSKQYEYLAFQKPILLPLSDDGDLKESILKYNAGFVANSKEEIIAILAKQYHLHLKNKPQIITRTAAELYELSRTAQEKKLHNLINQMK